MLAFPKLTNKEEMLFSDIENAVLNGKCDLGLIIHENRFTYKEHGLEKIIDLGCWWEKFADQAIPLGAIAINRNIPYEHQIRIDRYVRESLLYAYSHRNETMLWVRKFAQEMNEEVMRQHIELYVNEQTLDLGEKGKTAIRKLFEEAFNLGITSEPPQDIFL